MRTIELRRARVKKVLNRRNIKFPESFLKKPHSFPGATQWLLRESKGRVAISVIGGVRGLYGDGVLTFEIWDFKEDDVRGYMTKEQINDHIKKYTYIRYK